MFLLVCAIFYTPLLEMAKSRKSQKRSRRSPRRIVMYGGEAPVNYSNAGPMKLSLAQGVDFERYHSGQHGGMAGPYPASVVGSTLPAELSASARINPTLDAYRQIAGLKDPGQEGGRKRRKTRRSSRKSRKNMNGGRKGRKASRKASRKSRRNSRKSRRNSRKSRKQYGGDFVRWGGGGYDSDVDAPMTVAESSKMLISPSMVAQAGLHREWADAANPSSMTPK
jgi:hypothetical protein